MVIDFDGFVELGVVYFVGCVVKLFIVDEYVVYFFWIGVVVGDFIYYFFLKIVLCDLIKYLYWRLLGNCYSG